MTEGIIEVVRIGEVEKHPNADTLSITHVYGEGGYPCIFKTGEFKEGDLAVYVTKDSIVNLNDPRFSWLKNKRIKAVRLRGIFSTGLLVPANPEWEEGQDVTELLGIRRYQPGEDKQAKLRGDSEPDPGYMPKYDIDAFRKYSRVLQDEELVVITEKIHGTNARFLYHEGRLWVGSHKQIKKEADDVIWWQIARQYDLEEKLKRFPGLAIYGEIYGRNENGNLIQKYFDYGCEGRETQFRIFDVKDVTKERWLDWMEVVAISVQLDIPTVPVLFVGPWHSWKCEEKLLSFANGASSLSKEHIKEGIVIKPIINRYHEKLGRVILKYKSNDYELGNFVIENGKTKNVAAPSKRRHKNRLGKKKVADLISDDDLEKELKNYASQIEIKREDIKFEKAVIDLDKLSEEMEREQKSRNEIIHLDELSEEVEKESGDAK